MIENNMLERALQKDKKCEQLKQLWLQQQLKANERRNHRLGNLNRGKVKQTKSQKFIRVKINLGNKNINYE